MLNFFTGSSENKQETWKTSGWGVSEIPQHVCAVQGTSRDETSVRTDISEM